MTNEEILKKWCHVNGYRPSSIVMIELDFNSLINITRATERIKVTAEIEEANRPMTSAEHSAKYAKKNIALGLCKRCGKPAGTRFTGDKAQLCEYHLAQARIYSEKYRKERGSKLY